MTALERQQRARQRRADDERDLAINRTWWRQEQWARRHGLPWRPMPISLAECHQADVVESQKIFASDPLVIRLWLWLERTCHRERITAHFDQLASARNGSAYAHEKEIWVPPIQSEETAAIVAHEIGHCVNPRRADAPYRFSSPGTLVCVDWELSAWRWAVREAPVWTRAMHAQMRRALHSYLGYATAAEARAIALLTGSVSFAAEQQRRIPR